METVVSPARSITAAPTPRWLTPLLTLLALASSACSGDDIVTIAPLEPGGEQPSDDEQPSGGEQPSDGEQPANEIEPPLYALSSLVFSAEETSTYVELLDSLEPQSVELTDARELAGTADLWVDEGFVFVAASEERTVTKFAVEGRDLVERERVSFTAYGIDSLGFWLNKLISPTKAYLLNGASEVIVWNPQAMEITTTIALPELDAPAELRLFNGYSDRAAVVRDGKLYQTLYWTDETFFRYAPSSAIAVFDLERDELIEVLDAPCPGLDHATSDDEGNLYFSAWVYAPGGAVALDQPATCVVRIAAGSEAPEVAFNVADVTEGREGGVMRYLGDGRALLSVLHDEQVDLSETTDPGEVAFTDNWRFWTYDLASGSAERVESIDWNAGAQYSFDIDGKTRMLVALADYSATYVYDVTAAGETAPLLDTPGWSVRLFKVR